MEINFANLKKVSDKVEAILRSHPECKSDDNKLLAYFWGFEVTNKMWTLNNVSARQLLGLISRGTLTSLKVFDVLGSFFNKRSQSYEGTTTLYGRKSEKKLQKK
jgi:hypothetical protein